jgi:hypothetical protein
LFSFSSFYASCYLILDNFIISFVFDSLWLSSSSFVFICADVKWSNSVSFMWLRAKRIKQRF